LVKVAQGHQRSKYARQAVDFLVSIVNYCGLINNYWFLPAHHCRIRKIRRRLSGRLSVTSKFSAKTAYYLVQSAALTFWYSQNLKSFENSNKVTFSGGLKYKLL